MTFFIKTDEFLAVNISNGASGRSRLPILGDLGKLKDTHCPASA
jgi:hypothetical protein